MVNELKGYYDAIIIGSSAGGSSLAYKLSQVLAVGRGRQLAPDPNDRSTSVGYDVEEGRATFHCRGEIKFYGSAPYRMCESNFDFRVHGSPSGDPTEPARQRAFPYPPIEHSRLIGELVERIARQGINVSFIPLGLDGKCVLCSNCDAYYCKLDRGG